MGTVYLIVSAGTFLLETILQLCVVGTHSNGQEALFVILLALIMAPLIFINFVSAIQVTRTKDFTGKSCGRAICIGFHSFQLGIVWRSLKLLILYDKNDWLDYLNMRLFHCGFQSLPFCVVLAYSMFVTESKNALDIVTILCSLISASVAMVTYRTGSKVYEPSELEDRTTKVRLRVGIIVLTFSTCLMFLARCTAIVLFTVAETFWIVLPLSLHFIVHIFIAICNISCSDDVVLSKVASAIFISFINTFDMVGRDYSGVKCSYVLFYSVMLIENLVLSFYWMLTANEEYGDQFKLLVVLIVILCFIIGLILKFASCGCIYNIESDILSDAFNNPELKEEKPFKKDIEVANNIEGDDIDAAQFEQELPDNRAAHINTVALTVDNSPVPLEATRRQPRSKLSSSTSSSLAAPKPLRHYDNEAFVKSQGNISLNSHLTHSSHNNSLGSGNKNSGNSQEVSFESSRSGSKDKPNRKKKETNSSTERIQSKSPVTISVPREKPPDFKHNRIAKVKPTIIISDTSKHDTLPKQNNRRPPVTKASNLTLASTHSKYSRNTHTLNGSEKYYGYNGFEDPYRERRQLNKRQHRMQNNRHAHQHYHSHHRYPPNMDYSLDSSELYPSLTSDTSSVSTYTERDERQWRSRQRRNRRMKNLDSRDGYSTDVSNSDYLSFNDYSMEDSSSWTESSDSSSDGAATWPPSHTANLLKMYNIPDKESSTENIIHWLERMEHEYSTHDTSFSTLHEPSVASDTDISLSAMQTFEVKKEKKKFKRLMSKPKGLILKFSSLNYKGKEKKYQDRPFPLKKTNAGHVSDKPEKHQYHHKHHHHHHDHDNKGFEHVTHDTKSNSPVSSMPLPVDSVQESIV